MFEQGLNSANMLHLRVDVNDRMGWGGDQALTCDQPPRGHKVTVCFLGLTLLPDRCNLWAPRCPCTPRVCFHFAPIMANLVPLSLHQTWAFTNNPGLGSPQTLWSPWQYLQSRAVLLHCPSNMHPFLCTTKLKLLEN